MSDDEMARLEAEIAERQVQLQNVQESLGREISVRQTRLQELRPAVTFDALKGMTPREIANLDAAEVNRVLADAPAASGGSVRSVSASHRGRTGRW